MDVYKNFSEIPQLTKGAPYKVNMAWDYIEDWLRLENETAKGYSIDLDPSFQRVHVWDDVRRVRYVEYILRGGLSGKDLYFNHPNWMSSFKGTLVLVDGKQRLEAVRKFMNNEIPAFGTLLKDYSGRLPMMKCDFIVNVNNLKTTAEVLQWYIDLNAGGVAHTDGEIEKVRVMLKKETLKSKRKE